MDFFGFLAKRATGGPLDFYIKYWTVKMEIGSSVDIARTQKTDIGVTLGIWDLAFGPPTYIVHISHKTPPCDQISTANTSLVLPWWYHQKHHSDQQPMVSNEPSS